MKIILSRKGFDSSAGGHANPIYPDGEMFSLPIPSSMDTINYDELRAPMGKSVKHVIDELDDGASIVGKGAHADPDLIPGQRPRKKGWRRSLGQINQASGHLRNQNVGAGDLFLFYGWFRHTEFKSGRLRFRRDLPGYHAIYGYLEIDQIITANERSDLPTWLLDHPHAVDARLDKPTNSIYVARRQSEKLKGYAGAGVFRFRDPLILTKPGLTRSRWRLDADVFRHLKITYHTDAAWRDEYFQSYRRAQEYVIHADNQAVEWAYDLVRETETWDL